MMLKELIKRLESEDPEKMVKLGFHDPHSYRGDYHQLAFEKTEGISVKEMLTRAKQCIGETFTGWKGGEFTMDEYTDVYLAEWGETGEELGHTLLSYMLNDVFYEKKDELYDVEQWLKEMFDSFMDYKFTTIDDMKRFLSNWFNKSPLKDRFVADMLVSFLGQQYISEGIISTEIVFNDLIDRWKKKM